MGTEPKESITVQYIYSACIKTTTPNLAILHDPWFSQGIYDGSWYHFPETDDAVNRIGDCDFIFISHVHPDHYDANFLRDYFFAYGTKPVLIADHKPNYLFRKMEADGIKATIISEPFRIGNSTIQIVPHRTGSRSDIDSALILHYRDKNDRDHCVVNCNDIIFDDEMKTTVKSLAGPIDILCCGYTGAGPFPQTYFDVDDPALLIQAEEKRQVFFERYADLVAFMNARCNLPFAGQYLLGGRLSHLNSYRGVADAAEVLDFDEKAVVLQEFIGKIDSLSLSPEGVRNFPHDQSEINSRISEISGHKMDYEKLISESEISQLPIKRLLKVAAERATQRSECETDYFFCFSISDDETAVINANRSRAPLIRYLGPGAEFPVPRSEISIDVRYLFGLLTGIYHWNNAEIGSQYSVRRFPNKFNRSAQTFLNFFSVI